MISIIGYPKDVEDTYFGRGGIIANTDPDTHLIDVTTTSPRLAMRIYEEAKKAGLHIPGVLMTGGDRGVKDGTLTIPAGGDREDFDARPSILQAVDRNVGCEGKAGSKQHAKMCNQITAAGTLAGTCGAMVYVRNVGLNTDTVLEPTSTGAASNVQVNNMASRTLQDDYRPEFFIKYFVKGMSLAGEEARAADMGLKVLEDVLSAYKELGQEGTGELGTQTLIKCYNW